MQCKFYYLNKRKNSTKKPADGSELATYTVKFKSSCSSLTPTIELRLPLSSNPYGWNYAYLSDFAKYYYISDYTWNTEGWWEISLKLDVLASHVVAIKAGTYFIKYAEAAYNKWIVDTRIQQVGINQTYINSGNNRFFDLDGWFDHIILFFISETANLSSAGAVQAFAVTRDQLKDVSQSLYTAGVSVWNDLQAQAGNAKDCITKCITVPYSIPQASSLEIVLGNYATGVYGHPVLGRVLLPTCEISIPWQANDYRRFYHKFSLILPFVGAVTIQASDIITDSKITVNAHIDILTGDITYYVCHNTEALAPFATYKTNCAAATPVSSYQSNTVGAITSLASGAMSLASQNYFGAVSSVANAAADFCLSKTVSIIGNQGGCCEAFDRPTLVTDYSPTSIEPSSVASSIGRPYFAENTLSGFSGFVQTENAHIPLACLDSERAEIESLLNNGIYLE